MNTQPTDIDVLGLLPQQQFNSLIDIDVLELLPQRPPFIMIDKMTYFDLKSAKTVFTVNEDNLFCCDGVMEEAGLVENIAQTCAARTGFKQRLKNSGFLFDDSSPVMTDSDFLLRNEACAIEKVKIGVIGMINMLEIKRCPLVGERLETSMDIEEEFFSITFVRSEVKIGDEIIATCRMKLFLTDKTVETQIIASGEETQFIASGEMGEMGEKGEIGESRESKKSEV